MRECALIERWWLIPLLLVVGLAASLRYRPALLVGMPLVNLAIAVLIARAVFMPHGLLGRALNHRALVALGTISYSLYLWQQVFMNRQGTGWWTAFPVNLGLSLAMALLSYNLVEQPCLRLREAVEGRVFRARTSSAGA